MQIEEDHVVTLSYDLLENGPQGGLLERMDANYPFVFLYGTGNLLPRFEEELYGLKEGETFSFTLSPEEAYGQPDNEQVIRLPRHAFQQPGLLAEGNHVSVTDEQGQVLHGVIRSFDDQTVEVDFNHVMAGKTLHFQGVVLRIRKATVDELIRKHYIPEDGSHRPAPGEDLL